MTAFIELHRYRGFSLAGGPLLYVVVAAFVTLGFAPFQITKKFADLAAKLREIVQ